MVAFHGRHRPAEQNEGHRNRWNRRGISGVAEEAPDRIRRAVSVGLSSAVPSGLASFPRVPGSELPGYYRQSLRDYSPISAPKMSKLQGGVSAALRYRQLGDARLSVAVFPSA